MTAPVVRVIALDHIVLACSDVERSLTWYTERLGLPALRADLAQMDQLAAEARMASTSTRQTNESAAQLRGRIEETLADAGLSASLAQIEVNGEMIEARFRQADFEKWLYWLDAAVRETRLRVVDLSITRESAGVVSGRLALEAPRRGQ